MTHEEYVELELNTVLVDFKESILTEIENIQPEHSGKGRMYSTSQIEAILKDCEKLLDKAPYNKHLWLENRTLFLEFLTKLPVDGYITDEERYRVGKKRNYLGHIDHFLQKVQSKDDLIIDIAGCTGWASSIMRYLGYKNAYTIELNPISIIAGRYLWGHKNITQGNVNQLSNFYDPEQNLDLRKGNQVGAIFARYCFEHFLDLQEVFNQFEKVLKPGGFVYVLAGQTFKTNVTTGDLHAIPTAESVSKLANGFYLAEYRLCPNIDTGVFEHEFIFRKPAPIDTLALRDIHALLLKNGVTS